MHDQTPREQLAEIIEGETALPYTSKVTADRILSAGWRPPARVIKTTDGLETLAVGVFVVDDRGAVWRRDDAAWIACPRRPDTPLRIALPAVVLHTPENGDH